MTGLRHLYLPFFCTSPVNYLYFCLSWIHFSRTNGCSFCFTTTPTPPPDVDYYSGHTGHCRTGGVDTLPLTFWSLGGTYKDFQVGAGSARQTSRGRLRWRSAVGGLRSKGRRDLKEVAWSGRRQDRLLNEYVARHRFVGREEGTVYRRRGNSGPSPQQNHRSPQSTRQNEYVDEHEDNNGGEGPTRARRSPVLGAEMSNYKGLDWVTNRIPTRVILAQLYLLVYDGATSDHHIKVRRVHLKLKTGTGPVSGGTTKYGATTLPQYLSNTRYLARTGGGSSTKTRERRGNLGYPCSVS